MGIRNNNWTVSKKGDTYLVSCQIKNLSFRFKTKELAENFEKIVTKSISESVDEDLKILEDIVCKTLKVNLTENIKLRRVVQARRIFIMIARKEIIKNYSVIGEYLESGYRNIYRLNKTGLELLKFNIHFRRQFIKVYMRIPFSIMKDKSIDDICKYFLDE